MANQCCLPSTAILEARAKLIATSISRELTKEPDLLRLVLSLLENFKFQVNKLQRLRYCDHELAYVVFSVSLRLVSQLQNRPDGSMRKFVDELIETLESQKQNFESIRMLVSKKSPNLQDSGDDVLLRRFETLQSKPQLSNSCFQEYEFRDSISSQDLNQLIRRSPQSVLLLDFRSKKEFNYSHINFLNIVNIEPSVVTNMFESLSDPTDVDLEIAVESRLDNSQFVHFKNRFKFDLVVIYNLRFGGISDDRFDSLEYSLLHGDVNGFPSQSPFKKLIRLLIFQNKYISSRLKQYPVYIRGGLEKWHQTFGDGALTSQSRAQSIDAIDIHKQLNGPDSEERLYLRNFGDYLASAKSSIHLTSEIPPASHSTNFSPVYNLSEILFNQTVPNRVSGSLDTRVVLHSPNRSNDLRPVSKRVLEDERKPAQLAGLSSKSISESREISKETTNQNGGKIVSRNDSKDFLELFATGLTNLGNSCYMNCILQCLSATPQLTSFFFPVIEVNNVKILQSYKQHINMKNRLGSKGVITTSFVSLLANMFNNTGKYFSPSLFKQTIGSLSPGRQFATSDQQDCIEFLNFILDSLHEDLNQRVVENPEERANIMELSPDQERAREFMPIRLASTIEWERYLKLNFSVIVDYFQGQYLSQLRCLECDLTSTTYNAFSTLSLPLPEKLSGSVDKVSLAECLNLFIETELLDDDNKWYCPRCQKFTKLTKKITITRLPRVLIIHLKRFKMDSKGYFRKLDTFVTYPVNEILDLTPYWPTVGSYVNEKTGLLITKEREREILLTFPDRNQNPPFRYQLYGVVNHFGNLTTGHYTAYVRKSKGSKMRWCYFDDAKVQFDCKETQVGNKNAYCLFYLRIQ